LPCKMSMPEIPTDAEQRVILYGQQLQRFLSRGTITIACINTIWCKYVLDSQMDIFSYAPESNEAIDYDAFAKGFSQNIGENDLRSRNEYQPSVPEYMEGLMNSLPSQMPQHPIWIVGVDASTTPRKGFIIVSIHGNTRRCERHDSLV